MSDESGTRQLYVSPFPGGGGKWQVTTGLIGGGGFMRGGKEIIFGNATAIYAAQVSAGPSSVQVGHPTLLFKPPLITTIAYSADGQRFLMSPLAVSGQDRPFALVLDWPALMPRN